MVALASDPALVERLGRGARAFAEGLSWEAAAQATLAQLQRTIAERKGEQ
jgi:glycosyltransferase involved in cell wall biosynthesis